MTGELKKWHKVTLNLNGPYAHEQDNKPNPFTDYRLAATFAHSDGTTYEVPGYFAADGDAKNSSAESGNQWRIHFAPDRAGKWTYQISFREGTLAAFDKSLGKSLEPFDRRSGSFAISASDKSGPDLRAHGRLQYVGKHYLRFRRLRSIFLEGRSRRSGDAAGVRRLRQHHCWQSEEGSYQDLVASPQRLARR